ncbi:hypothetical protein EX895_005879 [Sporisorium graminicola]|uniref:Bromo domain-containing protein n=1 Tax=Sporisorium graminicola TaxID=280036 RepID=A0A4V6ET30_9BASI|nr:hypothetical protein EX895_005879 [Sporisorium graminicola]TKY84799.1 hypothetical protein EX895_005879 [Sporisorium graminicola]
MSRRGGIESSNILDGPRKRLRGNNDASGDDAPAAAASSSTAAPATASVAGMGAIERKIHSLSVDQVAQQGQRLMDAIMEAVDPSDGEPLHEFFLELPDAQEYPDYYEIIKRPMALDEIQSKLDQRSYSSLPDVKHDFETICNNAKRYNLRDTPVWLKARELHSLVKITYVHIVETLPEPSVASAPASIASADPSSSAVGSDATPSRPKRILLRAAKSQQKLNEHVQPKSEVQDQPLPPMPSSSHPRPSSDSKQEPSAPVTPARQQSQQPYSAADTPSSTADDDDADEDDDRWDTNDGDSSRLTKGGLLDGRKRPGKRGKRLKATLRQLIHDLRRVNGSRGYPLVANFEALPDRRSNPGYYQMISRPISLRDIEHRVFEKGYINAYALFTDLELMLNNAMTFYPPDSNVWQDAAEIRQYFEREAIPALIQDGFTLEKDDVRQSALPLHLAANSTIEAHKLAYKMIVSRAAGGEGASQSPEPSSRARLGSAGIASSPALSATPGLPAASPGAFGSPAPTLQPSSTTAPANVPMSMPMPMQISMPMAPPMSTPTSMSPMAAMPGMPGVPGTAGMGMVGSPGRPVPFPGTTMTPTASSPRPAGTPEGGRRPVGRPPGKGTPSRSNPYPFLERRVGPGRPKKHEAAARQAAIAAHEEMLRKQALQQQQEDIVQQQQAAALAAQPMPQWQQQQLLQQQQQMQQMQIQQQQRQQEQALQRQQQQQQRRQQQQQQQQQHQQQVQQQQQAYLEHQRQLQQQQQQYPHGLSPSPSHQMLPPGTPGALAPFGSGMAIGEPTSPVKRKEVVLPAEPREPPAFEGLEDRVPLISNFAIGMEVEEPDGQTLAVPPLEIKNGFATQHTLQIPPNASSITIEFPLRTLYKRSRSKKSEQEDAIDPSLVDGDVSTGDAAAATGSSTNGNGTADHDEAVAKPAAANGTADSGAEGESSLTWPWQPELFFNGKHTEGNWTAADALIDPELLEAADDEEGSDKEGITTSIGYSYCRVRLLPKRGINVFEITLKPEPSHPTISQIPAERYSIYFC